jgi:hypothetical protein
VPKPNIEKFEGNSSKFSTWLFQIEQANLIYRLTNLSYIAFMGQQLARPAFNWYQTIYTTQIAPGTLTTHEAFINLLRQQFTDHSEQDFLRQKLFSLKQNNRSLFLFNQDFNNALLHLNPRPIEVDLLFLYTHAIDPRIVVQVASLKPATLNDAMAAASEIAQFLRTYESRTPRTDNNTLRQNPNFTLKSKSTFNTPNLAINTNPNTQEKIKVNLSTQPSFNPTARNLFPSTPRTPYQPSATPNDPKYKCYRCGQPGHFTRSCPTRINQTEAEVPNNGIDVTESVNENKNITEYPRYLPPHKRTRSGLSLKSGRESVKASAISSSGPVGEIRTGAPSN